MLTQVYGVRDAVGIEWEDYIIIYGSGYAEIAILNYMLIHGAIDNEMSCLRKIKKKVMCISGYDFGNFDVQCTIL